MENSHTQGFLELQDADFYADPILPFETKIRIMESPPGIYLDGPASASVDEHASIVYVGSRVTWGQEHLRVDLRDKAALVLLRLDDNSCRAATAFRGAHEPSPISLRRTEADPADGAMAEHFQIESESRLEDKLDAGTYRAWVLLFDDRSNPVTTRLVQPESRDPEVVEYLKGMRRPAYAVPVSPPARDPYPAYLRSAASPPVPELASVALHVPRVTVGETGSTLVIHGSHKLPLLARELVAPMSPEEERAREASKAQGRPLSPRPTAVVAISLVLIGDTESAPIVLRLSAPTWDPIDPMKVSDTLVTGHFHIDLRKHLVLDYQTYAIWALGGGNIYGPHLAALVDPGLVPPLGE